MLVKLAFYAPGNSRFTLKNTQIMLDSQNNATLVPENALLYLKQNVQTQVTFVLIINFFNFYFPF